jgi:hypothetical protein
MRKCEYCGSLVPDDKNKCDACGAWCAQEVEKTAPIPSSAPIVPQPPVDNAKNNIGTASDGKFISNKGVLNSLVIFLVCVFFGMLGLHRFIQGKIFTGILWLITLGLLGIGYFADIVITGVRFLKSLVKN